MVSSSSAALRVVVPEPGGLGEPLRVTHSLTGGAGPPRPPAGLSDVRGMSNLTRLEADVISAQPPQFATPIPTTMLDAKPNPNLSDVITSEQSDFV